MGLDFFGDKDLQKIIDFGFRFLGRTLNECVLESFFLMINETDSAGRPLSHETVEKICFIRCNGPNPLVAKSIVRSALNELSGQKK